MDRDEVRAIRFAKREVGRVLRESGVKSTRGMKKLIDSYSNNDMAIMLQEQGVPYPVTGAVGTYLHAMMRRIRTMRYGSQPRTATHLSDVFTHTASVAQGIVNPLFEKKKTSVAVRCHAGQMQVQVGANGSTIYLGPNWKRRVWGHDIAVAEVPAKKVFVLTAVPKPSAFLKTEGVVCYEVEVFDPSVRSGIQAGYVFKSAGPTNGSSFVVFHTDFMRGVALIRRRISREVLDRLLGDE